MTPTLNVSSPSLATALAERLDEVAPPGFTVQAEDSGIVVFHNGDVVGVSCAPAILETVVRASISGVQDYIADASTEPWPGTGSVQPNPDATVEGDLVEMWFGERNNPVVRLRPITLPLNH